MEVPLYLYDTLVECMNTVVSTVDSESDANVIYPTNLSILYVDLLW